MKQKVKKPKKVLIIVLAAILVLVIGIVLFAGNFLFEFAVYPDASFTMNDLTAGGQIVHGEGGIRVDGKLKEKIAGKEDNADDEDQNRRQHND